MPRGTWPQGDRPVSTFQTIRTAAQVINLFDRSLNGNDFARDVTSRLSGGNDDAMRAFQAVRGALDLKLADSLFQGATQVIRSFGPTYAGAYSGAASFAGPALAGVGGYALGTGIYELSDAAGYNIGSLIYDAFHKEYEP